jgi:hypothetical protein
MCHVSERAKLYTDSNFCRLRLKTATLPSIKGKAI